MMRKVLLAVLTGLLFAGAPLFAQNTIPVTDSQSFTEGFENGGFNLWTIDSTGGGIWSILTGSQSSVASFSYENSGAEGRLISPVLDISSVSEATLTFSYAMMGFMGYDQLDVCYRSAETDSWHILGTHSLSDFNNFYEQTYVLPNLSATYQISFNAHGLGGLYLFVDNIEVASSSSCARPINLAVDNITKNSALLSWSTTGDEVSWTVELNGVETVVNTQPYLMEGLSAQTDYTFRVKANCGGNSESEWATPIYFSTLCDVIVVTDQEPYYDDFESHYDFVCWQTEIISGTDNWTVDPGYLFPNNTAFFIWDGGQARLISAPLDLTAVTDPTITFKHKQLQGTYTADYLSIWYRTNAEDEWHQIYNFAIPTDNWESVLFELPNPSSTYQISFVGEGHHAEGVYVDDVAIGARSVVGIEERPRSEVSISPNPTSGRVMVHSNIVAGEVIVYDMYGKQVAAASISNGISELDLSGYAKGVYVARLMGTGGTATVKIVKE